MKVLIVDDSDTVRIYHKQILSKVGIESDEAINGMEALEKSLDNSYDLYLVDINMPVLDGYSFVKRLRNELKKDEPVIMISTESEKKDLKMAFESGATLYLTKPVKPNELEDVVKMLVKDR